jgi:glycosyltransferase involved in cell wall biosynthesis
VEVHLIPFPRLWTHLRLGWDLRRHPPDVLFVPAHVMPVGCQVPTVVTVHDLGYLYYPAAYPAFDRWYLGWTTRRHARRAAYVVADSLATRRDLIERYRAEAAHVVVIYPGRDESLVRVTDLAQLAAARAHYGIESDYLLYLGTLQPRKNLARLLEAFARLPADAGERPVPGGTPAAGRLRLVLAGKRGYQYDELSRLADRLGLAGRVTFAGYVPDGDKAALLSGALGLVYPSLYEGFGLPILEAMACGTPVLTANVSSLPEVAGEAAVLVDPLSVDDLAAGLLRLVSDAALRCCLVEQGYRQLRRFSWEQAARKLLEVLDAARKRASQ